MTDSVAFGKHEYRTQGGEIHRRPVERESLSPMDAAWLVLRPELAAEQVPEPVKQHFTQAKDQNPSL